MPLSQILRCHMWFFRAPISRPHICRRHHHPSMFLSGFFAPWGIEKVQSLLYNRYTGAREINSCFLFIYYSCFCSFIAIVLGLSRAVCRCFHECRLWGRARHASFALFIQKYFSSLLSQKAICRFWATRADMPIICNVKIYERVCLPAWCLHGFVARFSSPGKDEEV